MMGARIALLRRDRGWSQNELGKRLGVSASAVGMYEQGRREPDCETLAELARILETSIDYLVTGQMAAAEAWALRRAFQQAASGLDGTLVLRNTAGQERQFGERELALLFAAVLGD